jgi:alkylhydroperoxidase/carboxymuconolactone decarboxylase family protein YurZ
MTESENFKKGLQLRQTLAGPAVSADLDDPAKLGPGMRRFREFVYETVLGNLWQRKGLDLKTRSLICVVTDVAMGIDDELAIHLRMARQQGWSEEELYETILHAGGYSGIPRGRQGIVIADRVFAKMREKEEKR